MNASFFRFVVLGLCLAALGGCASSGGMFGDASVKPTALVVTDFIAAPEIDAIDRGFSARMDRNGSTYPILERKRRTLARVNDEIVATIVVTLREAGLEAQPGSEEGLTLADKVAVVSGRLLGGEGGSAKKPFGFGPNHVDPVADMTVSYVSGGGRKPLTTFTVTAKDAGKLPGGRKELAARNAEIAAVLAAAKAAPEKLSPDVEAQARRLGRAAGEKVVAYAKEQGWIAAPVAADEAAEQQVKLPEPKPTQKPKAAKPDKPAT